LIKKIIAKKLRCPKKEFIWYGILCMRFRARRMKKFEINYALHSLFCFCIFHHSIVA